MTDPTLSELEQEVSRLQKRLDATETQVRKTRLLVGILYFGFSVILLLQTKGISNVILSVLYVFGFILGVIITIGLIGGGIGITLKKIFPRASGIK